MRLARLLLHAPAGTARETSLLDIGWVTLVNQLRTRLLRYRKRIYDMNDHLTVLMRELNSRELLPWEMRCWETLALVGMSKYQGEGKLQEVDKVEWKQKIKDAVRLLNWRESMHRLKAETEKSTRMYRSLMVWMESTDVSTFVKINSYNGAAIGMVHRMRAGFNFCNANAKLRHLTHDEMCNECKVPETEEHVLTECTRYGRYRLELQEQLDNTGIAWSALGLIQVMLYGAK
ncbi:unnamed protein product [Blepharisma stoltei]|uniref:Reverse transcriptase zinc-binding domain-containing protein n=1 Tax=Blepharisma stoltei TaxID=1481888 RepID=A0AAU9IAU6_9CILI|nr:unnamed protein product [Blepharisma stoltei]